MRTIAFAEDQYNQLHRHLLGATEAEQAAYLLCGVSDHPDETRWLVREVIPVPHDGFLVQEELRLKIDAAFSVTVFARAEREGYSVILSHSHPFDTADSVRYSPADDAGEPSIFEGIHTWVPGRRHASIVFGQQAFSAREWMMGGRSEPIDRILIAGRRVRSLTPDAGNDTLPISNNYDRQVRAFGEDGQRHLQQLRVGIVGLGGTGSIVSQQLAHLGVGSVLAIDDDRLEASNHSRVVGATHQDLDEPPLKVDVAKRLAQQISPELKFRALAGSVLDLDVALELRACDVVFACTDNLWSRAVLNQLAHQYLIPLVDMGTRVVAQEHRVKDAGGRVFVVRPGHSCLYCIGVLDAERVGKEALPPAERERQAREGYVAGAGIQNPAVISLNGVVASLAVTEFLDLATGFMGYQRGRGSIEWEVLQGVVWRAEDVQRTDCVCNQDGIAFAKGDALALPCR